MVLLRRHFVPNPVPFSETGFVPPCKLILVLHTRYDVNNRLVGKLLDPDGVGEQGTSEEYYAYDGDQILLRFEGSELSDLKSRYLWAPAVDLLLSDEKLTGPSTPGDIYWALGDNLNTVRDIARYNSGTDTTSIVNHRVYDAYGKLTSETAPTVDLIFSFTGRFFDEATGLQNNLNRSFDPVVGRWLSEDPSEFAAGDSNLYRYIGNEPSAGIDPTGCDPYSNLPPGYPRPSVNLPPGVEIPDRFAPMPGDDCLIVMDTPVFRPMTPLPDPELEGPSIGPLTDEQLLILELRSDAKYGRLPSQRVAAADRILAWNWAHYRVGALERFLTDLFRPQNFEPGIGGTTIAEQATMGVLGSAGIVRGAFRARSAPGPNLTPEKERAIQSLEQRIAEHQQKLADYINNPDAFDNQAYLQRAPTPEIRQRIIEGRIRNLERQIRAFQDAIKRILGGG